MRKLLIALLLLLTPGLAREQWTQQVVTFTAPQSPGNGGTGVSNDASNTLTSSGHFGLTITPTASTNVTFPTSRTLAVPGPNTFTGTQTFADGST